MTIMDRLEQQHQQQEDQRTSELLSVLLDRLDQIEKNQQEVVKATNEATQISTRVWLALEQMQRSTQQQTRSDASANDSLENMLRTLAKTQSEMLEVLASSRSVQLSDGSMVRASDLSALALTRKVAAQIMALSATNLKLADEVKRRRAVNVDHDKLAGYLVPRLGKQLLEHEHAVRTAFADASVPMLAELERSRVALSDAGNQVSAQVHRAGEQVQKLRGAVTWRTIGQISGALLPLAIASWVVFGMAQTVWAAFGLQPILQTLWGWFLGTPEWYWKLTIASTAFAVLTGFGWLTWTLAKKLHASFRDY